MKINASMGIDVDNVSETVNWQLLANTWCADLVFTRCDD